MIKKDQVNNAVHKINLVDFVRNRIDFFSSSAIKFKSNLKFQTLKDEIIIDFNEIKLQRIVDNNLTNAIKYTFQMRQSMLNCLRLIKCDFTIKRVNSKQILNPQNFWKSIIERRTQEGFGLGLNLVKRICTEENVDIKLESGENWASFTYTFKGYYENFIS